MDNEISEGMHLGTTLVLAVAIAVIITTVCGIVRLSYVYRERDVRYNTEVQERLIWKELHLEADYSLGLANKRHVTDTDATMKFIATHYNEYQWAVFMRSGTDSSWNCYTNTELTNAEKVKIYKPASVVNWQYCNPDTLMSNNTVVDSVYELTSARFVNNLDVQNKVHVLAYNHRNNIGTDTPLKWFENDYIPSKLGFYIFIIY